jgi:hypothetical protein
MERFLHPGQSVSFRLPVDTPPQVLEFLNAYAPGKKRSAALADLLIRAAQDRLHDEEVGERLVLILPRIPPDQREWLRLPETRRALGAFVAALLHPAGALGSISGKAQQAENADLPERTFRARSDFHAKLARSNFEDDE